MPNWKTYESTVRLLSAVLAAHPELKLNYGELAACFGSGIKKDAIRKALDPFKANARRIIDARKSDIDPGTLQINRETDISTRYGGGCTASAIENRFRGVKIDAKKLNAAYERGIDPITVVIGAVKSAHNSNAISLYCEDTSASAVEHALRPYKKLARDLVTTHGIAEVFGDGVTPKAVSTRFERMKGEGCWIPKTDKKQGSGSAASPSIRGGRKKLNTKNKKTAPGRQSAGGPKVKGGKGLTDDEDDDDDFQTPVIETGKKDVLNKTIGGRIAKGSARSAKQAAKDETSDNGSDDYDTSPIKHENEFEESFAYDYDQELDYNDASESLADDLADQ